MSRRVAFGGFLHETNTFAPSMAGMEAFLQGGGWPPLARGEAIFAAVKNINVGAAGFVDSARSRDWKLVPTLWCAASPSAHVTSEAFEALAGELIERITAALPLDGVYLDLHGAMVAQNHDDGEGELLRRVRAAIGPDVPLVVSLDLHGNVTPLMMAMADALVAYRTYPHIDMALTGSRSTEVLAQLIETGARPAKAFRQVPYLIPIAWQATAMEPCRTIYAELAALEGPVVPTLSFLPGFPAADFPDCGATVLAYGATQADANRAADAILARVMASEAAFKGRVFSPEDGVAEAMRLSQTATRPVVISDTQDNPGAGGDSDTMGMAHALVESGARRAAIGVIVDAAAAAAAHAAGEGKTIALSLGANSGIPGDRPLTGEFVVEKLSDGRFVAPGPFYGGSRMNLGPSACLRIGDVRIVVGSRKAQMADQAMYRQVGIEPTEQAILVNKSSVHFRADFEPIAETILVCAAPGPMPVDPSALPWRRLRPGLRTSPLGQPFA
ncbi:MAG: M81 family metallopeptidase [Bosea sp.]|uniref:M81 family metallopeptidase n=1 Tax=Bosea sp. (in: a-proteobacteria) TaxID=1871050 RepID=UPI001AC8EE9A|nr:M81 family metallopeptidase [Bosea sp. (in: a-proteobacteria)]MBN9451286.1 M81 family metallopeptidase [Bosea sp. (in: a-proteobacteria)]